MAHSHGRPDFNIADGRGYMLERNHAAAARLNLQFYLWKESLHFNLHPSVSVPNEARIADVATGSAMWLIDLARELPSARLDGFDIKLDQAPPSEWLPPNIHLRTWNVFDDVPEDMLGVYDVVHVRLLVLVVENSDPRPIVRNLSRMLKPGGYLQWDDLNYPETHIRAVDEHLPTPALEELRETIYSQGRNDWTLHLADICTEEGLKNAQLSHFGDSLVFSKANSEQHLLTMEEFASRLIEIEKEEEAGRIHQLIREVHRESLQGAALSMPRVVCVASKPGNDMRVD